MSERNSGGPAFPQPVTGTPSDDLLHTELPGMTLRDYFAAQVIQALLAEMEGTSLLQDATHAYAVADAMLEARKS